MALGLLLGFGSVGTSAYWSDQSTLQVESIVAGTLDIQIGPSSTTLFLPGQGGTWTFAVQQLDDVLPAESVAMDLYIVNKGDAPFEFTGEAWTTSNDFGSSLLVTTRVGGTARNEGARATGDRTGYCDGGTDWWVDHPVTTARRPLHTEPVTVEPGGFKRVCMLVTFSSDAPNILQGVTTAIRARLDAVQL